MYVKLLNKDNILVNDNIKCLSLLYLVPVIKYLNLLDNMKSFTNTRINNSLLEFNLKGLNLYNKSLKSFISKYNFINLILNVKNNDHFQESSVSKNGPKLRITDDIALPTVDAVSIKSHHQHLSNIENNHLKYLEKLSLNNKIANINYVKNINYKNISTNYIGFANTNFYDLLFNSFLAMNSLISKPVFEITNEKVKIHLFMYLFINKKSPSESFTKLNKIKLDILCQILSYIFKKPVQLELVRLYYPYFDSNIFVNLLSKLINIIQVRVIMKRFFNKAIIKNPIKISKNNLVIKIPSLLSGLNIRIGGRLLTQRIIPRKTVKTIRKGTLSKGKINFLDESRYTNKNKRGAYTLVVSIGHYLT